MPVGALIAGGLGAAGAIGSAAINSNAATTASQAQMAFGQQALGTQQQLGQQGIQTLLQMFQQAQGIAAPAIATGNSLIGNGSNVLSSFLPGLMNSGSSLTAAGGNALTTGQGLIGQGQGIAGSAADTLKALLTPGANMTSTLSQIPGFQFAQDWGQKAVQNIGSTTGLGGNVLKAGADYATGVAQQGYGNIVQQLQGLLSGGTGLINSGGNILGTGGNMLNAGGALFGTGAGIGGNLVNTGASTVTGPTNALIGGAVNTGNSAFGNLNTLASTIGGTTQNIGNASAAGTLGSANALSSGLTGAAGAGTNALFLSKLLGNSGNGQGGSGPGIYGGAGPGSPFMGGGTPSGL